MMMVGMEPLPYLSCLRTPAQLPPRHWLLVRMQRASWRSFSQIYATQYQRLVALAPTLPVWICEIGSNEPAVNDGAPNDASHSKSQWYALMFSYLRTTAIHVQAALMFNVRKERDLRVGSDASTLHTVAGAARAARTTVG